MAPLACGGAGNTSPRPPTIQAVMAEVNDYWQSHNSAGDNAWASATYWLGDVAAYDATGKASYLNSAVSWASTFSYDLIGGDTTQSSNAQAAGQVYIRLSEIQDAPSDRTHITNSIHGMVTSPGSSDWPNDDDMGMSMPNFAELGALNNDTSYFTKMYAEFSYSKSLLYDGSQHLWWENSTFVNTGTYWSRGNGWVFEALAKTLTALPPSDPHYAEYVQTFRDMAAALAAVQRSDGFWNSSLTNPSDHGGPETSGTSLFTYGLAWGINSGILDRTAYLPVVQRAWNGLVTIAVQPSGFLGYVQPQDLKPGSSSSVTTADFGVGAFLLAGWQVAQLQ